VASLNARRVTVGMPPASHTSQRRFVMSSTAPIWEKPPLATRAPWSPYDPTSRMAAVTTIGVPSKYAFWS
jgi:hypothetical protein